MGKINILTILFVFLYVGTSYGAEHDITAIATIIDAYEKQLDSIKLKYTYESFPLDEAGTRVFVKGTFAQKTSEGYTLIDERKQTAIAWDDGKELDGIARSYNGDVTRYLTHKKNSHGYRMAAIYKNHDPKLYKTQENPYYRVYGNNYKSRFAELLSNPNSMAKIQCEEVIGGLKAVQINFKAAEGLLDYHLWLLPEKNYVPIKLEIYHKKYKEGKQRFWGMRWGEFKEFPGNIWYPMNIKMYHRDVKSPTVMQIKEMDISPLGKGDFALEFPELTHVTDHVADISYLIAAAEGPGGIEHIPTEPLLSNKEKEKILDEYSEHTEAVSGENSVAADSSFEVKSKGGPKLKSAIIVYLVIAFGCVLAGAIMLFALTRRKKA